MLSRSPSLLGYQSKQLQAMQEDLGGLAGLSRENVASLLRKEPRILSYSCAGTVLDVADFLRSLGIEWEGIHELLLRQPRLFGANAERTLRPAVSALTEIGFSRADIARKIMQQPLLLYCKPERYREILRVMQEHGITIEVAKKALTKEPYFTARSIEGVKDRLQSFQQLTDPPLDLDTILQKSKLLRGTPANHAQMAQWLRTNLQLSEEDLRRYLSKSPGILEKSPEVMSRRLVEFTEAGFTWEDFKRIVRLQPQVYRLNRILSGNDAAFCKTMGVDMTDYAAFKTSRHSN
ncbi:hypothetical protein CVIRNUC_005550 [Coccomyxa viridis]|uniref:Uncharacterized protein n=1 Tax=Coccomyxa viridis TaxID=1274662 RepID=A0AAV1I4R2_9CHLO|nr:hypothetical protein CVIRNUC_005550 [Coccomyxa viridis]